MGSFAFSAVSSLLMLVVLPLWIAAGLADYLCHRATSIETTSGAPESALHLVQFALVGFPITIALFVDINAGYFLFAIVFLVLHHAVAAVDLVFASSRRRIAPREQMIHSFLEIFPLTALLLLVVLYWPQFLALFGAGVERAIFRPHLRLLPAGLVTLTLGSALLLNLVPYLEELYRCLKARRDIT
jgi:hypothetical protein